MRLESPQERTQERHQKTPADVRKCPRDRKAEERSQPAIQRQGEDPNFAKPRGEQLADALFFEFL